MTTPSSQTAGFDPPRSYPPATERWRTLIAKHFRPEQVGKAIWVVHFESAGDPACLGDFDPVRNVHAAIGLFQIQSNVNFAGRPTADQLADPEFNISYAAGMAGTDGHGWTNWGDGTAGQPPYDPKTGRGCFGALGNHPYPGDPVPATGGGTSPVPAPAPAPAPPSTVDVAVLAARVAALEADRDALMLALYAGKEQPGDTAARLRYARGRATDAADGNDRSVIEIAAEALAQTGGMTKDQVIALLNDAVGRLKGTTP